MRRFLYSLASRTRSRSASCFHPLRVLQNFVGKEAAIGKNGDRLLQTGLGLHQPFESIRMLMLQAGQVVERGIGIGRGGEQYFNLSLGGGRKAAR